MNKARSANSGLFLSEFFYVYPFRNSSRAERLIR
jgi:hypothetical protein